MLKSVLPLKALVIVICFLSALYTHAADKEALSESSFTTIEWTDLMPPDDLEALLNPPEDIQNIEDGSIDDQISSQIQAAITQANDSRYQQALSSTLIRPEYNHKKIRIPGFIVPLSFGDNNSITEFFIVPYFGACIHVPPPPPNQIIFGKYPKGFQLTALYDPFWVEGTLSTELIENDMATAAYSMNIEKISAYTD